ncbi:hypothetical protein AB0L41_23215 [Amycolatopsis mediterranei]|uniref:hypothetical protein n=1 Tax=Amycolatopsis mediterranei TaxID=33910 RepID=UPI00343697A1
MNSKQESRDGLVTSYRDARARTVSAATPKTIEAMAADAVTFIRALGLPKVDLLGFPWAA